MTVHQTSYGVICDSMPRDLPKELADAAEELNAISVDSSGMEVLRRVFLIKLEMLEKRVSSLGSTEKILLDDLITAMRGAVAGATTTVLAGSSRQTRMVEAKYLALLVSLVGTLLGGKKMSQQQQQQEVQDLVSELVAARKAFTAFNVTKELRAKGQQVFHRDLRNAVHGLFRQQQMADYQQTQVQPSGFPSPAILYYPPEVDPQEFTGVIITAKVQPTQPDPSDDDDEEEDEDEDEDDDGNKSVTRSVNSNDVLFVPRWMGRELKARQSRLQAYAIRINNEIEIRLGTPSDPNMQHVHVDPRNNMRIGRTSLIKLGADWTCYKISKEGNVIVIRKG